MTKVTLPDMIHHNEPARSITWRWERPGVPALDQGEGVRRAVEIEIRHSKMNKRLEASMQIVDYVPNRYTMHHIEPGHYLLLDTQEAKRFSAKALAAFADACYQRLLSGEYAAADPRVATLFDGHPFNRAPQPAPDAGADADADADADLTTG